MAHKTKGVITKVVKGYSLSPANIEWVANRALATSRGNESDCLDKLLTGLRERQERAEEAQAQVTKKLGVGDPYWPRKAVTK